MIYVSLNQIKAFKPCYRGWESALRSQGKTEPDDVMIPLASALRIDNISGACWLLGKLGRTAELVKFAHRCADSVAHLASSTPYAAIAATNATNAAHAAKVAAANATDANAYAVAADNVAILTYAAAIATAHAVADVIGCSSAHRKQQELNLSFLVAIVTDAESERV